jgi:hypothetical protein
MAGLVAQELDFSAQRISAQAIEHRSSNPHVTRLLVALHAAACLMLGLSLLL